MPIWIKLVIAFALRARFDRELFERGLDGGHSEAMAARGEPDHGDRAALHKQLDAAALQSQVRGHVLVFDERFWHVSDADSASAPRRRECHQVNVAGPMTIPLIFPKMTFACWTAVAIFAR